MRGRAQLQMRAGLIFLLLGASAAMAAQEAANLHAHIEEDAKARSRLMQSSEHGRSLLQAGPAFSRTYAPADAAALSAALADAAANSYTRVLVTLPQGKFILTSPLTVSTPTHFRGFGFSNLSPGSFSEPQSTLECGSPGMESMLLAGSELALMGVHVRGCSASAIRVQPGGANASITLEACAFRGNSRQLAVSVCGAACAMYTASAYMRQYTSHS